MYIIEIKGQFPDPLDMTIRAADPADAPRHSLFSVASNASNDRRIDIESLGPMPFADLINKSGAPGVGMCQLYTYSIPDHLVVIN